MTTATDEKDPLKLDDSLELEKLFKREPQRIKWVTTDIAEKFEREYYLVVMAKELIFYLIFLFCATMLVLAKVDTNSYYMTAAVKKQITGGEFTVDDEEYKFKDVRNFRFLHAYLVDYLAHRLYWTSFDKITQSQIDERIDRGVLFNNKLMGQPTMRQLAVKSDDCVHHKFQRFKWKCIEDYQDSMSIKDRLPSCSDWGSSCKYSSQEKTQSVPYRGKIANYMGDGYFVILGNNRKEFKTTVESLKSQGWYSLHTRVIFLDFTVYNPNLDTFCMVKLIFEVPAVGGIVPEAKLYTFNGLSMNSKFHSFAAGCFVIYAIFLIYYFASEIRELIYLKWIYFKSFWSWADMALLGFAITHVVLTFETYYLFTKLQDAHLTNFPDEALARAHDMCSNVQGFALFLIYIKIFKYFSLTKLTGQINTTLGKSGSYLFFFSIIFMVNLFAFAEFAYQVYGREIEEYSTIGVTIFTLLRTIMADFNYAELEKTHRIIAPIYFVLFIFMVFFVLINMFLAIICGNYSLVKTNKAVGPEIMQMSEFCKWGCHNVCKSMNCNFCAKLLSKRNDYNVAAEQIRMILNRCGFSGLDIDIFMTRYNIDPADLITVKDVTQLLESLRTPAAEHMKSKKPTVRYEPNTSGAPPLMALEDFQEQQKKLDEIEQYITSIAHKIEALLKKMNALSHVRKV